MPRDATDLLKDSQTLLKAFGLEKSKEHPHFPYGNTEEEVIGVFRQICKDRDSYLEFLDHYRRMIFTYEDSIRLLKREAAIGKEMGRLLYRYLAADSNNQSIRALMGNEVTKLIWLRRVGRRWRREVNELLLDQEI